MTQLFEQAIAEVLKLPEGTQNMAADALLIVIDYVNDDAHYRLTDEQIAGVHHAMGHARGGPRRDVPAAAMNGRRCRSRWPVTAASSSQTE